MDLKCPDCGNDKYFYRQISIVAKLKVNKKGEDLKTIYDVDKNEIDYYYEIIFCGKCDTVVKNED